jgi:peptidoglycan/xylan/chitin deacetylase (PgdA/CDA1 family)
MGEMGKTTKIIRWAMLICASISIEMNAAAVVVPNGPDKLLKPRREADIGGRSSGMTMIIHESSRPDQLIDGAKENDAESIDFPTAAISGNRSSVPGAKLSVTPIKILYLTFDDGPIEGTKNVLDILEEEGIEATMFCVGRHAGKRPVLFRRERAMPNLLIANHTYSHANGHYSRFYSDTFGVMSDIEHAQLILGGRKYLRLAGRNVWRIPEVQRDDRALTLHRRKIEIPKYDTLAKEGFYVYGWDIEWRFDHVSGRPLGTAESLAARIRSMNKHGRSAQKGKIILLAHDFMFRDKHSVAELRRFIRIMKKDGWSFRKIDHYSRYRPDPMYMAKYYGKKRNEVAISSIHRTRNQEKFSKTLTMMKVPHGDNTSTSMEKRKTETVKIRYSRSPVKKEPSIQALINNAVRAYEAEEVDRLIRKGARINLPDEYGRIALITAVKANSLHLVKKLLAYGADISLRDGNGATALETAQKYKRRKIEKFLIEYSLHTLGKEHLASASGKHINPLSVLGD